VILESCVEMFVRVFLNRKTFLIEEGEVFDESGRLFKVDKDANAAAFGRLEDGVEQANDAELWEFPSFWT